MNNKNPSRSEIRSTFFPKFDAGEFDGISGNSVDSGKSGEFGDTGESVVCSLGCPEKHFFKISFLRRNR